MKLYPRCRKFLSVLLLLALGMMPVHAEPATVKIGWTAWADAEFVTKLVRRLIEEHLGHRVELTLLDIALQYQGVARGDLDLMLMAWLPDTHADYWERYGTNVVDLGVLYEGARLGWVVPEYIPEDAVHAIHDLRKPEVADRLHRQIYGIDPGAGLMRLSESARNIYRLKEYTLIASSGAAMTAMVERAWRRKRWIVATAWRPHWMFHEWRLRFLDDPEKALGGKEQIHALGRPGLSRELPKITAMISRVSLSLDEVERAMARARQTDFEEAVSEYIREHENRVQYWVTGNEPGTGP